MAFFFFFTVFFFLRFSSEFGAVAWGLGEEGGGGYKGESRSNASVR